MNSSETELGIFGFRFSGTRRRDYTDFSSQVIIRAPAFILFARIVRNPAYVHCARAQTLRTRKLYFKGDAPASTSLMGQGYPLHPKSRRIIIPQQIRIVKKELSNLLYIKTAFFIFQNITFSINSSFFSNKSFFIHKK